jgi:hypothetical protein
MTCASYAAQVENLNDLAGVTASVNLMTGRDAAAVPAGLAWRI